CAGRGTPPASVSSRGCDSRRPTASGGPRPPDTPARSRPAGQALRGRPRPRHAPAPRRLPSREHPWPPPPPRAGPAFVNPIFVSSFRPLELSAQGSRPAHIAHHANEESFRTTDVVSPRTSFEVMAAALASGGRALQHSGQRQPRESTREKPCRHEF